MKRFPAYPVAIVILLLMTVPAFTQFEPQKGIFKGQFNITYDYLSTLDGSYINNRERLKENDRNYLQNSKCALWLLDNYKVSFAFWTIFGEPVCDYKFYWSYYGQGHEFTSFHTFNNKSFEFKISNLKKYPDLMNQLECVSPMPGIQIQVGLEFFNSEIREEQPIANCQHIITIDLADRAGVTDNFSLPGSGTWAETFTNVDFYHNTYTDDMGDKYWLGKNKLRGGHQDPNNKEAFERAMKILFQNTKQIKVNFYSRKIISLKWPVTEIMMILDEYCRREEKAALAKTKTPSTPKKEDDFWNTTSSRAVKGTSDEDFWNSSKVPTEVWTDKLDKADMLYRQKQWKEARTLYQEVASMNPNLSYARNKVKFIDKLLAYKPKADDTFTDPRDGKIYKIVQIGDQTWMAENLNYLTSEGKESLGLSKSWCNQCETYGRLYTLAAASKACPSGWHLPSHSEWEILFTHLGGRNVAGSKLKEAIRGLWINRQFVPTNESGFSALPAGCYDSFYNTYRSLGKFTGFLMSDYKYRTAYIIMLEFNYVDERDTDNEWGYSVRCIKN